MHNSLPKKSKSAFIAVGVVGLLWLILGYIFFLVSPITSITFGFWHFSIIPVAFSLLFIVLTISFSWVFVCKRRGYLTALGVVGFLLLRFFSLTDPFYSGLFFSSLLVFELCFFLYDHRTYFKQKKAH